MMFTFVYVINKPACFENSLQFTEEIFVRILEKLYISVSSTVLQEKVYKTNITHAKLSKLQRILSYTFRKPNGCNDVFVDNSTAYSIFLLQIPQISTNPASTADQADPVHSLNDCSTNVDTATVRDMLYIGKYVQSKLKQYNFSNIANYENIICSLTKQKPTLRERLRIVEKSTISKEYTTTSKTAAETNT